VRGRSELPGGRVSECVSSEQRALGDVICHSGDGVHLPEVVRGE
jgi:hypothetical protein